MKKPLSPLYFRIAAYLRDGITAQTWKPGDLLPSEAQLCRQFEVSRGTVVKALNLLNKEGLTQRRQGVGTFVLRPALHRMPGFLSSFSESVHEQGRQSSQRLLELRRMSRAEAAPFGCGEPGLLLDRVRYVDDVPWALHRSVIPIAVADSIGDLAGPDAKVSNADFSLYRAFADAGFNIEYADETLNVRLATSEEAELLEIDTAAAIMMIHRNSFDAHGRLLESNEAVYPGACYTYEARLVRTHNVLALNAGQSMQRLKALK